MGSVVKFVIQRLILLAYVLLFYVRTYLIPLFTFVSVFIFRLHRDESSVEKNGEEMDFLEAETELSCEKDVSGFIGFDGYGDGDCHGDGEEEKGEVFLKFKFPTFEEFCRIHENPDHLSNSKVLCLPSSTSKYDSTSAENPSSDLIEEMVTFPVEEFCRIHEKPDHLSNSEVLCLQSSTSKYASTSAENSSNDFIDKLVTFPLEEISGNCKWELGESGQYCSAIPVSIDVGIDNTKAEESVGKSEEKVDSVQKGEQFEGNKDFLDQPLCISEKTPMYNGLGSDSDSVVEHVPSAINSSVDSDSDGFLFDEDFGLGSMQESSSGYDENMESSQEHDDMNSPDEFNEDFLSEEDFTGAGLLTDNEKTESKESTMSASSSELDSLWEHQDLIDQLKMELKKVRDTGLPTILEESESPKIMEDLKPWKMDEKSRRGDAMGELHKFYKSYRERMRKFDILNYQKMYAMGILQLKVPLQSMGNKKTSAPSLKSMVSQNLWLSKHKIHGSDPMKKFVDELEGDVEVVYVGQMCASWEMLYWQYEKVLDLWDSDHRGIGRYNEVAGEFQQFQVLMQRFIENEPFQGPRVQNYTKTRCVLRNLLQVPVIRGDNMKDKKWREWTKDRDEYVITIVTLVEIVEESIRIFWRFVRADKDCTSTPPANTHNKIVPQLHDPDNLSLLLAVRKILQKKERKLKEMLRSENCILRRFRRFRDEDGEDDWDQALSFFSQVDMRLVSRVLRMSKVTRDQLIWCHDKLNRIRFVNRKMCVEPGFLLFPC